MVLRLVNQSSCQGSGVSRLLTGKPKLTVSPWPGNPGESISKSLNPLPLSLKNLFSLDAGFEIFVFHFCVEKR